MEHGLFALRTWFLNGAFTVLDRDFFGRRSKTFRGQPLEGITLEEARTLGAELENLLASQT